MSRVYVNKEDALTLFLALCNYVAPRPAARPPNPPPPPPTILHIILPAHLVLSSFTILAGNKASVGVFAVRYL
jgi:hypothetical protein